MELETGNKTAERKWNSFFMYCFAASLVIHLLTAWFSVGYQYQDEQSQIMDFAGHKLGMVRTDQLSWEYNQQIRSGVQPFMVVCVYRIMGFFHMTNPFLCSFIMRLLATILGLFSVLFLTKEFCKRIDSLYWKRFFVLLSCFMWPIAFVQSHFSCESISGSAFFLGLVAILAYQRKSKSGKDQTSLLLAAGALIGFAFVVRIQTVFMVAGLGLWCILIGRFSFKSMVLMALPGILVIGISILVDYWLYGNWVFTIYRYFYVNLILGKASEFGVTPFYYYFYMYYIAFIPMVSIFIMGCIVYAWFRYPKHILTWICVPFFVGHCLIAHKEVRFLWPMMDAIPMLLVLPFYKLDGKKIKNKITTWLIGMLWGLNIILLLFFMIKPGNNAFSMYEYLYKYIDHQGETLIISNVRDPYEMEGAFVRFQRAPGAMLQQSGNIDSIGCKAKASKEKSILVAINNNAQADSFRVAYPTVPLLYKSWPGWINYFHIHYKNVTNQVWYVYKWK